MASENTFETIVDVLEEISDISVEGIGNETLFSDLNLDSLDLLEITIALEEKLGIEINQELEVHNMTLGDFIAYVDDIK